MRVPFKMLAVIVVVTAVYTFGAPLAGAAPPDELPELWWTGDDAMMWYYSCPGDYNQDGLVTVSDLTPFGQHYGEQSPVFPDKFRANTAQFVIDGNGNGLIEVADLTTIGQHFGEGVAEYRLYTGDWDDYPDSGTFVQSVPFADAVGNPAVNHMYFTLEYPNPESGQCFWLTAVHEGAESSAGRMLEHPGPPPQSGQIDIRLASEGCSTGDLAVRIFAPEAGTEFLPEGAPVAILVPGGQDSHSVESAPVTGLEDFVNVSFSFPGVGLPPYDSGGVDDSRGENALMALRDVTRFCLGETTDTGGSTLQQLTECTVLHDNVGIVALSNGGALATAALGYHGEAMQGLDWFAGWENPTCSQAVVTDTGPGLNRLNTPAGSPKVYYLNPEYNGWGPLEFGIDYSTIAFDEFPPDALQEMVYLELGGLPRFDTVTIAGGALTSDLDVDGQIGPGEDWGFSFWEVGGLHYYSMPVVRRIWSAPLFAPGSEPAWLPTVAGAEAFWAPREAAPWYDSLPAWFSGLQVILCCTEVDHVQSAPDHPHIHQAFDGFNRNGIDVKINPSPEMLIELAPVLGGRTDLPDYGFGVEPADWAVTDYCVPEDVTANFSAAAARELAELVAGS